MKKNFLILLLIIFSLNNVEYAKAYTEWKEIKLDKNSYTDDGKIKVYSNCDARDEIMYQAEIWNIDKVIPKQTFYGADGRELSGTISYPNYNEMKIGDFELEWVYTPEDTKYEIRTGKFKFYLHPEDTEKSKGKIEIDILVIENELTSLTASTLLLDKETMYNININNKISGSSYTWISENEKVAKVNSKNGKVIAVDKGKTDITCKVTTPDGNTTILTSTVVVGTDDDNLPLLTETDLLLEVGDKFDINVGNKIKESKYKWVSSNKSIVKVTTTSGKVTALGIGEAVITCTITTPENEVIVLKCLVTVE